jgi:UDPglucose 6-dehydrogenase
MEVTVIGTGYVGLVAAACLADHGHSVHCVDIDEAKIESIGRGELPIYEPGLDEMVARNVAGHRLSFGTEADRPADVIFLAVGTPGGPDGRPDLRQLDSAVDALAPRLDGRRYVVVVNKSTVPVGTAERVRERLEAAGAKEFEVASNPEFLKEGSAVDDFMHPDRVVIGTSTERARDVLARLYEPFFRATQRVLFMDPRSAELTKYASNAYLAARVSFVNDIARLCDSVGADVEAVRRGMGSDQRIGSRFLYPGIGYGGSCFPKDTRALIELAREHGQSVAIVEAAEAINARQKRILVDKLRETIGELSGRVVTLWGLSFKPNTDDVREAPALEIARALSEAGASLRLHDPVAHDAFAREIGELPGPISYHDDPYEAAQQADALLLVTEWREFRSPDFARLRRAMRGDVLADGRNQWDRGRLEALGFRYLAIGR